MSEPWLNITWCDKDHGVAVPSYEIQRWVLDALYHAVTAVKEVYNFVTLFGQYLRIVMPSGLVISLFEAPFEFPDFRLPAKKFWAVCWFLLGPGIAPIILPLPKGTWSRDVQNWWTQITTIPGSQNWKYQDKDTGDIKLGTEFTPTRYYNVFRDGVNDVAPLILILALIYLLAQLGLVKAIPKFISFLGHMSTSANVRSVEEMVQNIETKVEHLHTDHVGAVVLSDIMTAVQSDIESLNQLKAIIGLKLSL